MRHGDLLNLINKHKRYCTAIDVSKDSNRAGKNVNVNFFFLTAQWFSASIMCQSWKWYRIWRQGLDGNLFLYFIVKLLCFDAGDKHHPHIHVAVGELGEREEGPHSFRCSDLPASANMQCLPSYYLKLSFQWQRESRISEVEHLFSLERPLKKKKKKTATMGLFSFPPTLSRAHDPRGKKAGNLTHINK